MEHSNAIKRLFISLITMLYAVLLSTAAWASFEHGIMLYVDGDYYYLAGAPDGPGGEYDVPGHYWNQAGPDQLVGKHYNTGPFGAPQWWSTDAPDGALLFVVHAVIDTWDPILAESYAERGYVHYHELLNVYTLEHHPTKVVWLRHTAVTTFDFDAGPRPDLGHLVTPGIDYEFMPNYAMPYEP